MIKLKRQPCDILVDNFKLKRKVMIMKLCLTECPWVSCEYGSLVISSLGPVNIVSIHWDLSYLHMLPLLILAVAMCNSFFPCLNCICVCYLLFVSLIHGLLSLLKFLFVDHAFYSVVWNTDFYLLVIKIFLCSLENHIPRINSILILNSQLLNVH